MIFENNTDKILYYSKHYNEIISDEIAIIQASSLTINAYNNFIENGLYTLRHPGRYKYFEGLAAIPPKTRISISSDHYEIISNISNYLIKDTYTIKDLLENVEFIINNFRNKKIAVELSGGLDSSLVIEALLKYNIEPILIGFSSDFFEFRTERIIQEHYKNKVSNSILLRYEDHFAFENLKETPLHPIPVSESHFYKRHKTVAELAKKLGVDVVFSGEAGDQLLSSSLNLPFNNEIPLHFGYWCLAEHWTNQYVYKNLDIEYISAIALGKLPSIILSLRNMQNDDPMKLWARKTFKKCLPIELSGFAYTAFHNAWVSNGLIIASEDIEEICEYSYNRNKINSLRPDLMKRKAIEYGSQNELEKKEFLSNLAYSTWLFSLKMNKLI